MRQIRLSLLLLLFWCLCNTIFANDIIKSISSQNLKSYGVRLLTCGDSLFRTSEGYSETISLSLVKDRTVDFTIKTVKGQNTKIHNISIEKEEDEQIVFLDKNVSFPFCLKSQGFFKFKITKPESKRDPYEIHLKPLFTGQESEYIIYEEEIGFVWVSEEIENNDSEGVIKVYNTNMDLLFTVNSENMVSIVDVRDETEKDIEKYEGYEGVLFQVTRDDFGVDLYDIDGKQLFSGDPFFWPQFIASKRDYKSRQKIGFWVPDLNNNTFNIYDSKGNCLRQNLDVNKHMEIWRMLPESSTTFLPQKDVDLNLLYHRNDIPSNYYYDAVQLAKIEQQAREKEREQNLEHAKSLNIIANDYFSKNQWKKAAEYYEQAFNFDHSGITLFNRGVSYLNDRKYQLAINDLKSCLSYPDLNDDVKTRAPKLIEETYNIIAEKEENRERIFNALLNGLTQIGQNMSSAYKGTQTSYQSLPVFNYNSSSTTSSVSSNSDDDDDEKEKDIDIKDIKIKCPECGGSGKCRQSGVVDARTTRCGGSGKCPMCNGNGRTHTKCPKCKGDGCPKCDDTGYTKCTGCDGSGECDHCGGSGKCPRCNGTGKE